MPKKILLADDSITIQKVVELTFSDGDYEVTAVNNGAKALQKLSEMRPDIILSDIIMPEKNGYEVCEFVKSHPEYRNIPVVLLTGTFEPFDPDRAEKAGCDAVVTKPFESQSLIHKVEELIAQSAQSSASAAAPEIHETEAAPSPWSEPEQAPSPWMEEPVSAPEPASPFTTSGGSFPTPPQAFTHDSDLFGSAPPPQATTEMPFETPAAPFGAPPPAEAFSSETRAFTKMSFEDMQQLAPPPPPPVLSDSSPWDEPATSTPAEPSGFSSMSFDEAPAPMAAPEPEAESPFGAPAPSAEFSGETRAFPRMSFEELQQLSSPQPSFAAPEPEPEQPSLAPEPEAAEPSPWDEPPASPFSGETRAFPKMSFEDMQNLSSPAPAPEPAPEPETASPWAEPEPAAFSGETRAFPKMSFEDMQNLASGSTPAPEPEPSPWEEPSAPSWSSTAGTNALDTQSSTAESFTSAAVPFGQDEPQFGGSSFDAPAEPEDLPFSTSTTSEPEAVAEPEPAQPIWSPTAAAEATAERVEPAIPPAVLAPDTPSLPIARGELSDDQIDRIARRVVELMSDQVVRNIAWEVIPDLAEMVVKERIRQLESEA
jgi:CheY-like chemotaxis protein